MITWTEVKAAVLVKESTSGFGRVKPLQKAVVCQSNTAAGVNILLQTRA